jgi:hypothetical protein
MELDADFPNPSASRASLADANLGGWTDFIVRATWDYRWDGVGKLDLWMRKGSASAIDADPAPWVHVLQQLPKRLVRNATFTLNRGIGFNFEGGNNNGGLGRFVGIYISKENVWTLRRDFVIYTANEKLGDENCSFSQISPDGSTP